MSHWETSATATGDYDITIERYYFRDADGDGYGSAASSVLAGAPPVGYVLNDTDCNDSNPLVNPGMTELCDSGNIDENCNWLADNADPGATGKVAFYADADGDGFGAGTATQRCDAVGNEVSNNGDCDDARVGVHALATFYLDADGDGFGVSAPSQLCETSAPAGYSAVGGDCDDSRAGVHAVATFYVDADGDGFGVPTPSQLCETSAPSGYSSVSGDCDDTRALYADADGDGHGSGAPVACGVASNDDNCPAVANAAQSDTDLDGLGDACDGDIDGDGFANGNDAFPGDSTKSVADASLSAEALASFLATASNVGIDATGMSAAQLRAIAQQIGHVATGGIVGAFTLTSELTEAEIRAILSKVFVGSSFAGAVSTVTVDGGAIVGPPAVPEMGAGQLDAVADNILAVAAVTDVTITAALDAAAIGALVSKAANGEATIVATGMDAPRLAAAVSGSTTVVITGFVLIDAGLSPSQISEVVSQLAPASGADASTVRFDTAGMDSTRTAAVQAALASMTAGNGGVNPYCDTTDADHDGWYGDACYASNVDCDDGSTAFYPGALENCANLAQDNDCDGDTGAAEAVDSLPYYVDADTDGFGSAIAPAVMACTQPAGFVLDHADCNDGTADVHPGAAELCLNLAIDNDCDGSTAESEATDRLTYYRDADGDGYGAAGVTALGCSAPAGYVANATDCNDGDAALNPATTWYPDADGDGRGVSAGAVVQCVQPAGFVLLSGDGCPNDANKLAPGDCGCGAVDTDLDGSGVSDCLESPPLVTAGVVGGATEFKSGATFVVRFAFSTPRVPIDHAELSASYDSSVLEYVGLAVPPGSAFTSQGALAVNQALGTVRYVVGAASGVGTGASLADVTFRVKAGAAACGNVGLVGFTSIAGHATTLHTTTNFTYLAQTSPLGLLRVDGAGPVLSGVPASATMAADAGTTAGAHVAAPVVTALDACDGDRTNAVGLQVTYPDGTTGSAWPSDGMFPVGVTTLAWTVEDTIHNQVTEARTIEVLNHQLLDVGITLNGVVVGNSTRRIRVNAGASEQIVSVAMTHATGTASAVQVPVAVAYPCIRVKDADHSVSATIAPSVSGARWSTSVQLRQGDCNDDDVIDIFDYATLIASRGANASVNHPANFNADTLVSSLDITFISVSFFHTGQLCNGLTGGTPRDRVSIKDLRRRGLGYLEVADLTRDGWVDQADIAHYLQYGAPMPAEPWMPVESEN